MIDCKPGTSVIVVGLPRKWVMANACVITWLLSCAHWSTLTVDRRAITYFVLQTCCSVDMSESHIFRQSRVLIVPINVIQQLDCDFSRFYQPGLGWEKGPFKGIPKRVAWLSVFTRSWASLVFVSREEWKTVFDFIVTSILVSKNKMRETQQINEPINNSTDDVTSEASSSFNTSRQRNTRPRNNFGSYAHDIYARFRVSSFFWFLIFFLFDVFGFQEALWNFFFVWIINVYKEVDSN